MSESTVDIPVVINGTARTLPGELTLTEFIAAAGHNPTNIAVAIGDRVLSREEWGTSLADLIAATGSNEVDILTAVQGG